MSALSSVQALARLGSGEPNPVFEVSPSTYTNTLGKGLSDLLLKLMEKGGVLPWLLKKLAGESSLRSYASDTFQPSESTYNQLKPIMQIVSRFLKDEKLIMEMVDDASDTALLQGLFEALRKSDRVAMAAIWYPLFYYWGRQISNDQYLLQRLMQTHLDVLVLKPLPLTSKSSGPDLADRLLDAGLLEYVYIHSLLADQVDLKTGYEYTRNVIGHAGKPDSITITNVPLTEQIRTWEQKGDRFRKGQAKAIELLLTLRGVSTYKNDRYRLDEDFIIKNPRWVEEFVESALSLAAFDDIAEFMNNPSRFVSGYGSIHAVDSAELVNSFRVTARMVSMEPERYAKIGVNIAGNVERMLKRIYDLKG